MKECPNCHNQADDHAPYCPVCGTVLDALGHFETTHFYDEENQMPVLEQPVRDNTVYDHTGSFYPDDIAENKLLCMIVYLLDAIGVIIALLMSPASEYTRFHIRQSLKFTVLETVIILASSLFFWTFIVPILGIIALAVLMIAKILCFVDVCKGMATESIIIRNIKFLN